MEFGRCRDGTLVATIWNLAQGAVTDISYTPASQPPEWSGGSLITPDGKWIVSGGDGSNLGAVRVWDASEGTVVRSFDAHHVDITALAIDRSGTWLATSGPETLVQANDQTQDFDIKIWDFSSGTLEQRLTGNTDSSWGAPTEPHPRTCHNKWMAGATFETRPRSFFGRPTDPADSAAATTACRVAPRQHPAGDLSMIGGEINQGGGGNHRASMRSRLLFLVAVAAAGGCLPRGEPPAGRQILADRQATLGPILPSNGDGLFRFLILRPGTQEPDSKDLFVLALDPAGGPPTETLLVSDLDATDDMCMAKAGPCRIDPSGRVWTQLKDGTVVRIDPITGQRLDLHLPQGTDYQSSPSGQRFVTRDMTTNTATLYDASDQPTTLATRSFPRFVGEDFYFATPQGGLMRIPPSGVPEQLATELMDFTPYARPGGVVLLLTRAATNSAVQGPVTFDRLTQTELIVSVRDPLTGQETVLDFGTRYFDVSPDGRWLLPLASDGQTTFFDYRSGIRQVVDLPSPSLGASTWRPGHDEIWVPTFQDNAATISIARTDGTLTTLDAVAQAYVSTPDQYGTFTADGAFWFSNTLPFDATKPIQVGVADDPTGPRVNLNPPGTNIEESWPLADGRFLTAVYPSRQERADIMAVDPLSGASQLLAERGSMAAVGQTRFIGMFHFDVTRGDLTAVELATGRSTILAPEFAVTAVAEPQGTDLVAPGARILYEFQARTASPYDGIWLVSCP